MANRAMAPVMDDLRIALGKIRGSIRPPSSHCSSDDEDNWEPVPYYAHEVKAAAQKAAAQKPVPSASTFVPAERPPGPVQIFPVLSSGDLSSSPSKAVLPQLAQKLSGYTPSGLSAGSEDRIKAISTPPTIPKPKASSIPLRSVPPASNPMPAQSLAKTPLPSVPKSSPVEVERSASGEYNFDPALRDVLGTLSCQVTEFADITKQNAAQLTEVQSLLHGIYKVFPWNDYGKKVKDMEDDLAATKKDLADCHAENDRLRCITASLQGNFQEATNQARLEADRARKLEEQCENEKAKRKALKAEARAANAEVARLEKLLQAVEEERGEVYSKASLYDSEVEKCKYATRISELARMELAELRAVPGVTKLAKMRAEEKHNGRRSLGRRFLACCGV